MVNIIKTFNISNDIKAFSIAATVAQIEYDVDDDVDYDVVEYVDDDVVEYVDDLLFVDPAPNSK